MKAQYKNAVRSRQLIRKALIELLRKKNDIMSISVSDIVKTANINRGTFYNHYRNPIEVLEEMRDEQVEKFSFALKATQETQDVNAFIDAITNHIRKNEDDYRIMLNAIPISVLDRLKSELIKKIEEFDVLNDPICVRFFVNGVAGLYLDVLKKNANFSYEDVSENLKCLIGRIDEK